MYDPELIRKVALHNDDLWLKTQELLQGVDVVKVKGIMGHREIPVKGSQKVALCKRNRAYGNDEIMKAVFTHYELYQYFPDCNWTPDAPTDSHVRRLLTEWLMLFQKICPLVVI